MLIAEEFIAKVKNGEYISKNDLARRIPDYDRINDNSYRMDFPDRFKMEKNLVIN